MGLRRFFEILFGLNASTPEPASEMQRWQIALSQGMQARRQGDYASAQAVFDDVLAQARQAHNRVAEATALGHIGALNTERQRWDEADRVLQEAVSLARAQADPVLLAAVLNDWGDCLAARGEKMRAQEVFGEALAEARKGTDSRLLAHVLGRLADLYLEDNNASYARRLAEEACQLTHYQTPGHVGRLGEAAIATGHEADGHRWIVQALRLSHALGDNAEEIRWAMALARRYAEDGKLSEAGRLYQRVSGLMGRGGALSPEAQARFLLDRAEVSYQTGHGEEAIRFAEEGLALAEQHGFEADAARAHGLLGVACRTMGRREQAEMHLKQALDGLPADAPPARKIEFQLELGRVQQETNPDLALESYGQAAAAARDADQTEALGRALLYQGRIHHAAGRPAEALALWREAADLFEQQADYRQLAALQCDIANVQRDQGDYKQALNLYEQALVTLNSVTHPPTRGLVLSNVANMFTDTGDIETARAFFDESIAIARDTGDRVAEGLRLGNLGWFYIVTGRYTEAVDTLEHALKISEKNGAPLIEAVQLNNLGLAYARLGDLTRALSLHRQALGLLEGSDQPRWRANFLSNMGETLIRQGDYDGARAVLEEAIALSRTSRDQVMLARSLWRLGDAARRQNQVALAETHYAEAAATARHVGAQRDLAMALLGQGRLAVTAGQTDRARELLGEAARLLAIQHAPEKADAEAALSEVTPAVSGAGGQ